MISRRGREFTRRLLSSAWYGVGRNLRERKRKRACFCASNVVIARRGAKLQARRVFIDWILALLFSFALSLDSNGSMASIIKGEFPDRSDRCRVAEMGD